MYSLFFKVLLVDRGKRPSSDIEATAADPETGSRMPYMKETTPQTPVPRKALINCV